MSSRHLVTAPLRKHRQAYFKNTLSSKKGSFQLSSPLAEPTLKLSPFTQASLLATLLHQSQESCRAPTQRHLETAHILAQKRSLESALYCLGCVIYWGCTSDSQRIPRVFISDEQLQQCFAHREWTVKILSLFLLVTVRCAWPATLGNHSG